VLLGRQIVLQQVANLGPLHPPDRRLANSNLKRVDAVLFQSFDLRDLAAVQLDDRAWLQLAPLVPKVSHAHLVAHNPNPGRESVRLPGGHKLEILVYFFLERPE
jgi:hypothetical protein